MKFANWHVCSKHFLMDSFFTARILKPGCLREDYIISMTFWKQKILKFLQVFSYCKIFLKQIV